MASYTAYSYVEPGVALLIWRFAIVVTGLGNTLISDAGL
jgi:hypothetical protein